MSKKIIDGIMGVCVADALGLPVQFIDRETLRKNPVVSMIGHGTFNMPAGTWSDDSSLTLCLLDSLSKGLNYDDIMKNFIKWYDGGEYTPFGRAFDIGGTTSDSMERFLRGKPPLECGGKGERDNGNGSLMRILPILFHLDHVYGERLNETSEAYEIIHNVSSLTHAHKRSQMACGIYISIASLILRGADLEEAVRQGIDKAMQYYRNLPEFASELSHYERMEEDGFARLDESQIRSSGYVVHTLEAAVWCLLNTKSYRDCILKAVNLGEDTDTVGAVAGGLAGLCYGCGNIPQEWLATIARREYIEELCSKLEQHKLNTSDSNRYIDNKNKIC